jgi:hypothetical protein
VRQRCSIKALTLIVAEPDGPDSRLGLALGLFDYSDVFVFIYFVSRHFVRESLDDLRAIVI